VFTSDVPILVTQAIANKATNAFAVTSAVSAETAFAFSQRKEPSRSYISFTILNRNDTSARVRLRSIDDSGETAAQVSVVVEPNSSLTRSFNELLSDSQIDGFIHISSDVPVFISALETSADNTMLANLPALRLQQGYNPPTSTQLRLTGTVRRNGTGVPGVRIQLSGALNVALFTNTAGAYVQRVTPGQYTVEPSDPSYVFFPFSRTVTITEDDGVGNDFEASLVGPAPRPTLLSISPATAESRLGPNATPLLLTAAGTDFIPGAKLLLGSVEVPTQFVSTTLLTASIPANLLEVGGTILVSVQNPAPSLGMSEKLPLSIVSPIPTLNSIDPVSVTLSSAPVSISLIGENFAPNSIFELTPPCASIFVTSRISSEIGTLSINPQCAGTYYLRVRTPEPGGGTSQTLGLTVN
jgi:hypothetical protein